MNFNLNRDAFKMAELLDSSPRLRRLVWGVIAVAFVWVMPPLITAIRWW